MHDLESDELGSHTKGVRSSLFCSQELIPIWTILKVFITYEKSTVLEE